MTDLTIRPCHAAKQALMDALERQDTGAIQSAFDGLLECARQTADADGLAKLLGEVGVQLSRLTELPQVFAHLLTVATEPGEQASIEHEWGTVAVRLGQYDEAESHLMRALSIRRELYGSDIHPDVGATLNALGTLNYAAGRFPEAVQLLNQVVSIHDALNQWDLKTAGVFVNLGNIEIYRSDFKAAETHFRRATAVWEAAGHPPHFLMVGTWNGLGTAATYQFQHLQAKEWYERALQMYRQLFGENASVMVAGIYHNLGNVFAGLGRYEVAVQYYLDSLRLKDEVFKTDLYPDVLLTVEALGVTYREVEQLELAKQYSARAVTLAQAIHGDAPHLDTIAAMTSAAGLQEKLGNRDAAQALYRQALEMTVQYPGGAPLFEAALLHLRLAQLALTTDERTNAAEHFQQALTLSHEMYGENNHPNFVDIYHGQARLAMAAGNLQEAWESTLRGRDALGALGELATPEMWIASDELLGELHAARGEASLAVETLDRALNTHLEQLPTVMSLSGQSAIAAMNRRRERAMARLLRLHCQHPELQSQMHSTYELWLNFKGSASALDMGLRTLVESKPALKPLFEEVQSLRRRLSRLRNAPEAGEAFQETLQQYRAAELSLRGEAREVFDLQQVTLEQLLASLSDTGLLDYALLDGTYFAFHISSESVRLFEVGPQDAIDALIRECQQHLQPTAPADLDVFRAPAGGAAQLFEKLVGPVPLGGKVIISPDAGLHDLPFDLLFDTGSGQFLLEQCRPSLIPCGRDLVRLQQDLVVASGAPVLIGWPAFQADPAEIEKLVGFDLLNEVEHRLDSHELLLEVQPSGTDAAVAVAVWKGAAGLQAATTVDHGIPTQVLKAVGSVDELLGTLFPAQKVPSGAKVILLQPSPGGLIDLPGVTACPDLSRWLQDHPGPSNSGDTIEPGLVPAETNRLTRPEPDRLTLMGHVTPPSFMAPLPSTFTQVVGIRHSLASLQPSTFLGAAASSSTLQQVLQPPESPAVLHITTHGIRLAENHQDSAPGATESEPMEQAVLFLAGASGLDSPERQGVLSAFEFAGLNLQGTKLVNLATCQSGLGQTLVNEGQYGFVAASFLAGARATMTTLWSVESRSTERLMVDFYRSWFRTGKDASTVLGDLKLQRLQAGVKPFYWAGFVVHGQ
ncbi:CHAT domain-containing protein [Deinococcus wulumuqiensis]